MAMRPYAANARLPFAEPAGQDGSRCKVAWLDEDGNDVERLCHLPTPQFH